MCRETEGDRVQHMAREDAKEASNVAAAGRHILAAPACSIFPMLALDHMGSFQHLTFT